MLCNKNKRLSCLEAEIVIELLNIGRLHHGNLLVVINDSNTEFNKQENKDKQESDEEEKISEVAKEEQETDAKPENLDAMIELPKEKKIKMLRLRDFSN